MYVVAGIILWIVGTLYGNDKMRISGLIKSRPKNSSISQDENPSGERLWGGRRGTLLCKPETGQCTGSILQTVFGCNFAVCGCISLAFQWLVFYLQAAPGCTRIWRRRTRSLWGRCSGVWLAYPMMEVIHWEPEVMDSFPPGWV